MSLPAAQILVPGTGSGEVLRLQEDISFWGAIDPLTGKVIDRRHPQFGICIAGKIVVLRRSIGSSSGSAILMETLYRGCGPAAIILGEADQILTLGAVVAKEMSYATIPVLQVDEADFEQLHGEISIDSAGKLRQL